jgi:hypothetical protein
VAPNMNDSTWWYTSTFSCEPPDPGMCCPTPQWKKAGDRASLRDCIVCVAMFITSIAVVAGTAMGLAMVWPQ